MIVFFNKFLRQKIKNVSMTATRFVVFLALHLKTCVLTFLQIKAIKNIIVFTFDKNGKIYYQIQNETFKII